MALLVNLHLNPAKDIVAPVATSDAVLSYWFSDAMRPHWFDSTDQIDADIRQRFETTWQAATRHELDDWCETAGGCLALVVVLDQFPLNMYRGQEISFSSEAQARNVANLAIERGFEADLSAEQLSFLYLPYMHSESLSDQAKSIDLYFNAELVDSLPFAQHHYDIVEQFGRFPHRNAILGRQSTAEEIAYLTSPGGFQGGLKQDKIAQ